MSFELGVEGGRIVSIERWQKRIARFGANVEFHPKFRFEVHSGFLPLAIAVEKPTLFPGAERYRAAGRLGAGFELGVWALGPSATPEAIAARRQFYEELRARNPSGGDFPQLMLDSLASDKQSLSFLTTAGRSGADYLAQVLCAVAYALEAGARFDDPQVGEHTEGDAVFGALARLLNEFLDDDDVEVGTPFSSWD